MTVPPSSEVTDFRDISLILKTHDELGYVYHPRFGPYSYYSDPTLADVVEGLQTHHRVACRPCSRSVQVECKVWIINMPIPFSAEDLRDIDPGDELLLDLGSSLEAVARRAVLGCANLLVETVQTNVALPTHTEHRLEDAVIVYSHGGQLRLPEPSDTDYALMCRTHGLLLVDKVLPFLRELNDIQPRRIPIVRRPKGFGKTTALSSLATYLDVFRGCERYFPHAQTQHRPEADTHDNLKPNSLFIMLLDFADLHLSDSMTMLQLVDVCTAFLSAAAHKFVLKYWAFLHAYDDGECGRTASYEEVVYDVTFHGHRLFVGIDNYTAPFKDLDAPKLQALEFAVSQVILNPIQEDFLHGRIKHALIIGEQSASHLVPWRGLEFFERATVDKTEDQGYRTTVGFSPKEIIAIGTILGVPLWETVMRSRGARDPDLMRTVYSAGDVMRLARSLAVSADCPVHPVAAIHDVYTATTEIGVRPHIHTDTGVSAQGDESLEEIPARTSGASPTASPFAAPFDSDGLSGRGMELAAHDSLPSLTTASSLASTATFESLLSFSDAPSSQSVPPQKDTYEPSE